MIRPAPTARLETGPPPAAPSPAAPLVAARRSDVPRNRPERCCPRRRTPRASRVAAPPSPLFAWSGGGIVLLGERRADRWVVARGWRDGDRLSDVRRWSFAEPRAFAGQVRRLVRDATADRAVGSKVADEALAWAGDGPPPA